PDHPLAAPTPPPRPSQPATTDVRRTAPLARRFLTESSRQVGFSSPRDRSSVGSKVPGSPVHLEIWKVRIVSHVSSMLETYPKDLGEVDKEKLAACIAACFECAQTCTACADACLAEDMVAELTSCIRTDLDCADICLAT